LLNRDFKEKFSEMCVRITPTNACAGLILDGVDYGWKVSINAEREPLSGNSTPRRPLGACNAKSSGKTARSGVEPDLATLFKI